MPFNAGVFSVYTPGNPVVTGTIISSTVANNTNNDFAVGLSNCVLKDGTQTLTAPIKFYAGTVTLPGISFAANPGNGFYNIGSSSFGVAVNGAAVLNIASGGLGVIDGLEATPSLRFSSHLTTGIFYSSSNELGVSVGGTAKVLISTAALKPQVPIASGAGGGAGAPDYQFFNDTNTGLYAIGADNIGVACGGANALDIAATGIGVGGQASSASTAVATPASTTAISSVRLPPGVAPSAPVNGDMWTTTAGLFVRINGVTVGPLS